MVARKRSEPRPAVAPGSYTKSGLALAVESGVPVPAEALEPAAPQSPAKAQEQQ